MRRRSRIHEEMSNNNDTSPVRTEENQNTLATGLLSSEDNLPLDEDL